MVWYTTVHISFIVLKIALSTNFVVQTNKAHQRANHIIRCFLSGHTSTLIRAFILYVRPILEYNCVMWSPSLKRDIDLIERVQRRFTKRLRGLKDLSYTERLLRLNIPILELRRLQLDLIFCYKIVFGQICTNFDDFFTFSPSPQTRGHPCKLHKSRCTHAARRNFFVEWVIDVWNYLQPTVNFDSLPTFRSSLKSVDFSSYLKRTVYCLGLIVLFMFSLDFNLCWWYSFV